MSGCVFNLGSNESVGGAQSQDLTFEGSGSEELKEGVWKLWLSGVLPIL
jgi:hypothetical protein